MSICQTGTLAEVIINLSTPRICTLCFIKPWTLYVCHVMVALDSVHISIYTTLSIFLGKKLTVMAQLYSRGRTFLLNFEQSSSKTERHTSKKSTLDKVAFFQDLGWWWFANIFTFLTSSMNITYIGFEFYKTQNTVLSIEL